jgi:hypothetical protein
MGYSAAWSLVWAIAVWPVLTVCAVAALAAIISKFK